jgi:RNA polymerase sigma factor for flagellar operon FliA
VWKALRLVWPRVQGHVDKSELVSLGDLGLAEAASRWDPDGGASFATFAWYRVQGAILDGLRRQSDLPRRIWAQIVALRAAGEYLEAQLIQETALRRKGAAAAAGGDTAQKLREVKDAVAAVEAIYTVSIRSFDEVAHSPEAEPGESLDDRIDRAAQRRRVAAALAALPERERALVEKHYLEGKNLLEAGAELGISKSWASRLHAQAVARLRASLAGDTS